MTQTKIANNSETSLYRTLYKVKNFSMYGERIESVVEVPHLVLGSEFTKKNVPATRSNSFHDLPSYLAIIGPDMFINNNLIVDFGTDESNTAEARRYRRPSILPRAANKLH